MKNALVVSKTEQTNLSLKNILTEEKYENIVCATRFDEAKCAMKSGEFDLILINTPIEDENGLNLAVYSAKNTRACVFVTVKPEHYEQISEKIGEYGVFVISRPINRSLFHHFLLFTGYFKNRMLGIMQENDKLKDMVEELKEINRAKLLLMQCLSMSEQQAHKYLEQQAMDLRVSKREVALQVIKTYQY